MGPLRGKASTNRQHTKFSGTDDFFALWESRRQNTSVLSAHMGEREPLNAERLCIFLEEGQRAGRLLSCHRPPFGPLIGQTSFCWLASAPDELTLYGSRTRNLFLSLRILGGIYHPERQGDPPNNRATCLTHLGKLQNDP